MTLLSPIRIALAVALSTWQLTAQIRVNLHPETVRQFDSYAQKVEQQLTARWHGKGSFLELDENNDERKKVLSGELSILPGVRDNPVDIDGGLVHDWLGDVFIPGASMQTVLEVLQDFDRHAKIYPEMTRSRLVSRHGNHIVGYWRLEKHDIVTPVVLDVTDDATYEQIAPDKWICRAYAKDIAEVDNPGSDHEKHEPVGHGYGYLWRLYAYWSLQATDGGVLAECRTLSLSRSVPPGFGWAVKPFIKNLPRDSLASTLRATRKSIAPQSAANQ